MARPCTPRINFKRAWILQLTPLHWLLLSLTAWRALYQLVAASMPGRKTERDSKKLAARQRPDALALAARALSQRLKDAGDELPVLAPEAQPYMRRGSRGSAMLPQQK